MFVLSEVGQIYVFRIVEKVPEKSDIFAQKKPAFTGEILLDQPILIKNLPQIKQMACGLDHFLALDKKGTYSPWVMIPLGSVAQAKKIDKPQHHFFEVRHRTPMPIKGLSKIQKVVCGFRHSLVISEDGRLFGWGFNSMQQLSNADKYMNFENQQSAIFDPVQLLRELEGKLIQMLQLQKSILFQFLKYARTTNLFQSLFMHAETT